MLTAFHLPGIWSIITSGLTDHLQVSIQLWRSEQLFVHGSVTFQVFWILLVEKK